MRTGRLSAHRLWVPRTIATDYSFSLTATMVPSTSSRLWATPAARDWKDTPGMATRAHNPDGTPRRRLDQLARQVFQFSHPDPTTTPAGPLSAANFNLSFVEWLMGFPIGWTAFAPVAMASFHFRQRQHWFTWLDAQGGSNGA
jgi:hypothetical protein